MRWLLDRLNETLRLDTLRGLSEGLLRDIGLPHGTMRRDTAMDLRGQTHRLDDARAGNWESWW